MAAQNRHSAPGLIDQARAEPYRFSFFQLVRLLRLHYSHQGRLDPESLGVGGCAFLTRLTGTEGPDDLSARLATMTAEASGHIDAALAEVEGTSGG